MELINLSFNFLMEGIGLYLYSFLIVFILSEALIYIITKFIF